MIFAPPKQTFMRWRRAVCAILFISEQYCNIHARGNAAGSYSAAHCLDRTCVRQENTSPRRKSINFRSDQRERERESQEPTSHSRQVYAERLIDRPCYDGAVTARYANIARGNFITSLAESELNRTNLHALNHRYVAENEPPNCPRGADWERERERGCVIGRRCASRLYRDVMQIRAQWSLSVTRARTERTAGASLHALLRVGV